MSVNGPLRGELLGKPLSPREREVMGLIVAGLTSAEIRAELVLAEGTVWHHWAAIKDKLGARTKAHAVALWLRSFPQ